jgi:TetR/AcrR family transcriptional regulator, transcriptional repressor for nem operon
MVKQNKKQEILKKGFEVMYLKGYHGTSVQDIVDAADIPKGSFYHYFRTKEQFAIEALGFYTKLIDEEMQGIFTELTIPSRERILKFYAERIIFFELYNYKLGCFAGNLTQEIADTNETMRIALNTFFLNHRVLIVQCLREAQDNGDISSDYNADDLADYIVNSYEGAMLRMKSVRNPQPLHIFQTMLERILS